MPSTVVVTGASGFIGKHITKALLDGGYRVRATVRSDAKAAETRAAVGTDGDRGERLEFVHLDLMSDEGWDTALVGTDALLHTASPFPLQQPKNPDELIRPAVDGTLRALTAATANGVGRVVLTSSCVAIYNDELRPGETVYDETNWTPVDSPIATPYDLSKTLAERAAWEYVSTTDTAMSFSTVNPGVVLGAPLDDRYGTSLQLVERLLAGTDPMLPRVHMPIVDVLDVARLHVLSLQNDAANGERFAATSGALWFTEMAEIIKDEFPDSKVKTRQAPDFMVRALALVMKELKTVTSRLGHTAEVSGAKAERTFGIELLPPRDAVVNAARAIR